MSLFLRLLAAHFCGDLIFNGPFLASAKRSNAPGKRMQSIGTHCLIHVVCVLLWLWPFDRQVKIWACVYVFAVHFLIDYVRTTFEMRAIPEGELRVVKRRQALLYLIGRADQETNVFLGKYLKLWLGAALVDQGLHMASLGVFVFFGARYL